MTSPLQAAILASECGTGKTNVFLTALWINVQARIRQIGSPDFEPQDGEIHFSPSLFFTQMPMLPIKR